MKRIIFILLLSQNVFCQSDEINKLLSEGEKAFLSNDFMSAREIYTKATKLDSLNKNALYNLAATELNLGNNNMACEHFYKLYQLNDGEALKDIKKYCTNFRNGTIMFIDDADEKPKFVFEEKQYPLFDGKNISSKYREILIREIKKSKILKGKVTGKAFVQIHIDKTGVFDGKVIRIGADEKDIELAKMELLNIFRNIVIYIPAKHKGINIELFDKWTLPIDFGD